MKETVPAKHSKHLQFLFFEKCYEFQVGDGKYGIKEGKGFNGLIRQLIPNGEGVTRADLALGALTVTSHREKMIGFTKPFRDFQVAIVIGELLRCFLKFEEYMRTEISFQQ